MSVKPMPPRELLDGLSVERPAFICREVMIETVWVLERSYRFAREQIAIVVNGLVTAETLVVESADAVSPVGRRATSKAAPASPT